MLYLLFTTIIDTSIQIFLRALEPILLIMVLWFVFKSTLAAVGLPLLSRPPKTVEQRRKERDFLIKPIFKVVWKFCVWFYKLISKVYKKIKKFFVRIGMRSQFAVIFFFLITVLLVLINIIIYEN